MKLFSLFLRVVIPAVFCQLDCGISQAIGTAYSVAMDSMVYLNLNNPAQCNGTISSYQYCYYPTIQLDDGNLRFNAILAMFRRDGNNNYQYINGSNLLSKC